VHLPVKAECWDAQFSPQGDRIVWPLVQEKDTPTPFLTSLRRYLPVFFPKYKPKFSLWVSRINGSQMHQIGYVPLKPNKEYGGVILDNVPERIYWLPDGKRLSFWLQDTLYTVPAD